MQKPLKPGPRALARSNGRPPLSPLKEGFPRGLLEPLSPTPQGSPPTPSLPLPSRSSRLKDSMCTVSRVRRRGLQLRSALPSDDYVAAWSSQGGGRLRSQLAAPDRSWRLPDPRTLLDRGVRFWARLSLRRMGREQGEPFLREVKLPPPMERPL